MKIPDFKDVMVGRGHLIIVSCVLAAIVAAYKMGESSGYNRGVSDTLFRWHMEQKLELDRERLGPPPPLLEGYRP